MKQKNIEELELLAAQNNSEAIYELGNRYFIGKGIKKDYEKAKLYFDKAISLGNEKGKYGIGKCYYYGNGMEQDYEKAYNIFYELMTQNKNIDAEYRIGVMYYEGHFVKQNYEMAYNIFKDLAEQDDTDAQRYIADMYYFGLFLPKDYNKSFELFKQLYENKNDKYSLMMLSGMYYYGQGTDVNYKKAREYGELCEQYKNDKYIEHFLGDIYFYGKDTEINYEKARNYYEKSLNEKHDDSYFNLGIIYQNGGYGVEKNIEKSQEYFFKIENDFCSAVIYYILALNKYNLENWIETINYSKETFGELLAPFPKKHPAVIYYNKLKTLSLEQYKLIAETIKNKINSFYKKDQDFFSFDYVVNEEEVDILCEVIIQSSEYESMDEYLEEKIGKELNKRLIYMIGMIIYEGRTCEKNINEGLYFLKQSAKLGYPYAIYEVNKREIYLKNNTEATKKLYSILNTSDQYLMQLVQNLLGKIYYYGINGVEKDYKKAFSYFESSFKEITSKEHMGKSYYYGRGVDVDYAKAYKIFNNIKDESRLALFYLGEMYRLGYGVTKDFELAYKCYKKSAEQDYPQAQYQLAMAYLCGNLTNTDIDKTVYWLERAAKHDYGPAQYQLGIMYYYGQDKGYNISKNKNYAIELLTKSSEGGIKEAKDELYKIQNAKHCEKDVNDNNNDNLNIFDTKLTNIDDTDAKNSNN